MSDYIPALLRQQVYARAGGQCEYCLMPQVAVLVSLEVEYCGPEAQRRNKRIQFSVCVQSMQ